MQRLRNVAADVLVGIVVVVVVVWLLRGVLRFFYWSVTLVVLVVAVAFILRIASKLRG
jgi:hypothetical protein